MFLNFFLKLRDEGFPVSLHEYLALLEGLDLGLVRGSLDDFYYLSKSVMVKNEVWLDRFDTVFKNYFHDLDESAPEIIGEIPEAWLVSNLQQFLTPEELEALRQEGGLEELKNRFRELLEKQQEKHEGGNTWIGAGGTSPFGQNGANAEGFSGGGGGGRKAAKIWNRRDFANLSDKVELNTRNIKMALRKLRKLTREGVPDEFDLDGTIQKTSENAGLLDIQMRPSRRNRIKVLLFMDVGGSMYDHVHVCEQLFSAAKHEFKHMEYFYFHNCIYESVWKDNRRRHERVPTMELLAKYKRDYKVIFLGDAAMSPYELLVKGGSIEHFNDEPGLAWIKRVRDHFDNVIWINPNADYGWQYFQTTMDIREAMRNRMFPMTIRGLELAMKALRNQSVTYDEVWIRM